MTSDYAVLRGSDVGKGTPHAVGLDPSGKRLHDRELPQDESSLRELFGTLQAYATVLVVVDQPALHPGSARTDVLTQRRTIADAVEEILDAHARAELLTSMPGIGVRTATRILLEVGDGSAFPTAGHLAAYAGVAPVTRRPGSSIRGEHPPQAGLEQLERALFRSAFAAPADSTSRAHHDRTRAAGKRHDAAVICLARRRVDVVFAVLRERTRSVTRPPCAARPDPQGHPPTLPSSRSAEGAPDHEVRHG